MNLSGLPDDTNVATGGVDIGGLPDDNARILRQQYRALASSPDEAAAAFNLSKATGIPKPVVERNRKKIEDIAAEPDWGALDTTAPVTVEQLVNNTKMFELARDDTQNMADIEKTIRESRRSSSGLINGPVYRRPDEMRPVERSTLGAITEPVQRGLARGRQAWTILFNEMTGLYKDNPDELAVRLANQQRGVEKYPVPPSVQQGQSEISGATSMSGALGAAARNPQAVLETTLESLGVSAPALTAAAAGSLAGPAGTAAGAGAGSFAVEYASTIQDVLAERGTNMMDAYALSQALRDEKLMTAAREKGVKRGIPIAAFDALTAGLAGRLLAGAKPTVVSTASRIAGETAVQAGGGAAGEATAQAVTGEYKPGDIVMEALAEIPSAVVEVPGNVREIREKAALAQQSVQEAQALQQINALAAASKLRARDPQSFEQFVAAAIEDGPVQDVYIDARTLQQAGVDMQALAQASPAVAAQVQEALATGGDIVIPVSEYAAKVAGTELDAVLTPHLRTSEEGLSLDEAQRYMQGVQQEMQQAAEKAMAEREADTAWQTSAKQVEDNLFQQLQQTGRFTNDVNAAYATLMRDFYVATAQRLGITPSEMFQRYPLQVKAEGVAAEQRMEQPPSRYTREQVEAQSFKEREAMLAKTSGVMPRWLPVTDGRSESDSYIRENGEFAFATEQQAMRYAKGLELGEGGRWGVQQVQGQWRAKKEATLNQSTNEWLRQFLGEDSDKYTVANANETGYTAQPGGQQNETDRPGVQANQEPATVGGGTPRVGWATATSVRRTDGKPALVYRGAGRALSPTDFDTAALGHSTGNPSSGLGAWFTFNREEAARYGGVVEGFHLDLRNPKEYDGSNFPAFDSLQDAQAFARDLQAQGYDGVVADYRDIGGPLHFVAFNADTVIRPAAPKPLDMGQFFQAGQGETVPQTETPEFKAWFGDSKVVDAEGKPLVVYHGTKGAFSEFNPSRGGEYGSGIYLTQDEGAAWMYADRAPGDGGQNIMPVYASIENPYRAKSRDDARAVGVKKLQSRGYDGIIAESPTGEKQYIAFESKQIKSAIGNRGAFDPNDPNILAQGQNQEGNRGEIAFARDITAVPSVISLYKTADLSTLLHELGHFQLEVLANIASRPDAPAEIVDDFNAALNWFRPGMTAEEWNAMSLEEKRPYHEQFARGFEAYLFEGKAPSAELDSLFHRFRAWMLNVYKSIKALSVEISPEIRQVFDRLLATDEAIKQAEAVRAYAPLFTEPAPGMDPALWEQYKTLGSEATQKAIDDMQKRSLRDVRWLDNARSRIMSQLQRDARDKRKAVEAEVRAEVAAMPVYAVQRFLKYGELADADRTNRERKVLDSMAGGSVKLSLPILKETYGEDPAAPWRYLSTGKNGMAATEGVHPDLVAELFGFASGDQMVREILAAQPVKEVVEGMTDQRVLERYGDLANPDTIARAADEAIHNEARARFVATELKALTQAQGPVRAMTSAAKIFAETMIARKKVRDIKPNQHATAEARAAKAAQKALASGDTAVAAAEKRNQLIQNYATRTAYNALDEIDKAVKYLRKFDGEGTRKGLDTDYLDQIDQLLERFDLRASVTNKAAAKRARLAEWLDAQREAGFEPDIPPELVDSALRKPYREMTLEELRGLVDSVKQIEHLGRLKKKLLTAKDEREFQAIRDEMADSIEANARGRTAETRTPTDALGKLAASLRRFWASHIKAATWANVLDGGKDGGPMWEHLIRTANERGDQETQMRTEAAQKLAAILAPVVKKWPMVQGKGRYFESVGRSFTREGAMAVALNTGNEGNLQRLLDGEGWTRAQINPVLESLTAEEWAAVQAVWDHFDSYRPAIAEKERRVLGKEPAWVEPVPFTTRTADGQEVSMRGGYYPVKYDPAASARAEEHADAEAARQQMRAAYVSATTRRSFTKGRAEEVTGRPLLYSLAGVYTGTNEVIHDLSWHEWLIDANRLLRSLDTPIRQHYGPEVVGQFKQWVKDVAQGETRADHPAEVGVAWLRQSVSAAGLGFNVMSAVMQITGFNQSIVRVGPTWIGRGIAQYSAAPAAKTLEVTGKSSFMENRFRTQFRELNEVRNRVEGQTQAGRLMTLGTYFLMMRMQRVVDVPTWLGAYEKAIAQGNNEERSIALADQAVIDSQGSGMLKDLSTIERGGQAVKLFTVFYSYMNTALNMGVRVGMTEQSRARLAAKMLMLYTVPVVLSALLKEGLTPGGGDDDDGEKLVRKLAAEQISYLTGLMVGVREFGEVGKLVAGAEGVRDYAGPAGVRVVADALKFGQQAMQGEMDTAAVKAAINLLGDLTGLPAAQINRILTGAEALESGKTDNPAALVFGHQR